MIKWTYALLLPKSIINDMHNNKVDWGFMNMLHSVVHFRKFTQQQKLNFMKN